MMKNLEILEKRLGYFFKNIKLLQQALIHRSYAHEAGVISNERLEFLGDAVLELAIRTFLFEKEPKLTEGELSRLKAFLVEETTLAEVACSLGLSEFLWLGKGEKGTESILADTLEAVIAAIYLDSDFTTVKKLIKKLFNPWFIKVYQGDYRDYKTELQNILQSRYKLLPTYRILKINGPDHDRIFQVGVFIKNELWGKGKGKSRKKAEQNAAKQALQRLKI